jgi:serine/threonine protein kinase
MTSAREQDVLSDVTQDSPWQSSAAQDEATALPSWLATLVDLAADPDSPAHEATGKSTLLDKAYEAYCRRREAGEQLDPDAYCEHFPHLQSSLARLIRAHRFLEDNPELLGEMPATDWPEPGQAFLGFELQQELGRGAFARVFLATEPALGNRQVAVKVSQGGGAEANTLGRINHPNIVSVYSVQEDPVTGLTAVCMPYHGSATLCLLLDKVKAYPKLPRSAQTIWHAVADPAQPAAARTLVGSYIDGVCAIGAQLAEALQFIHDRHICHRDLKPSNVLMTPDGKPMLLDFNLCDDPQAVDTREGGTLPYMPPEQLLAAGPDQMAETAGLDARSDLFSLGVMLYELLTGQHPFGPLPLQLTPPEARDLLLARQQTGARPVRQLNPEVDTPLAHLVEQCLAYDPLARPQRAADVAGSLRRHQSHLQRARRWVGGHVWQTAVAAALFLGITGAAVAFLPEPQPEAARLWRFGKLAYADRKYPEAIDHFNALDVLQPGRVDVWKARARTYQGWGENNQAMFNQAAHEYLKVLDVQPDGYSNACRGYCLMRLKLSQAARQNLMAATAQGFESAEHFNNLGFSWLNEGFEELDKAFANLTEAIKRKTDFQAAYYNRAMAHLQWVESKTGRTDPRKKAVPPKRVKDVPKAVEHLTLGKEDISRALALAKDSATAELCWHAATIWAVSSDYDAPQDLDMAFNYLETALAKGLAVEDVHAWKLNEVLRGNPRLQKLLDDATAARSLPGYVAPPALPPIRRILDPVRD